MTRVAAHVAALAPIDSTEFYAGDPHRALARVRREAPVLRDPHLNVWLVSLYADVRQMSRNPAVFSVAAGTDLNDALHGNVTNSFFAADAELITTTEAHRHDRSPSAASGPKRDQGLDRAFAMGGWDRPAVWEVMPPSTVIT
jgi:cytochrome P450